MGLITTDSPYFEPIRYSDLDDQAKSYVTSLIESCTTSIERYCNRVFAAATYAEVFDGDGSDYLIVKNRPINSLTSIVFKGSTDTTYLQSNGYFDYNSLSGEIRWRTYTITSSVFDYYGFFPRGFQNIVVNYNGGFTTIPEDVKEICAQMVMEIFSRVDAPLQVEQEKINNHYVSFGSAGKSADKALLTHKSRLSMYKNRRIAGSHA